MPCIRCADRSEALPAGEEEVAERVYEVFFQREIRGHDFIASEVVESSFGVFGLFFCYNLDIHCQITTHYLAQTRVWIKVKPRPSATQPAIVHGLSNLSSCITHGKLILRHVLSRPSFLREKYCLSHAFEFCLNFPVEE